MVRAHVFALIGVLVASHAAFSATPVPQPTDTPSDVSLEINIEPSRSQPTVGSSLGITAELKNKSKKAVLYLTEDSTTLTLTPELEGPLTLLARRPAFFPTENVDGAQIAIQPGRSYRIAWTFGEERKRNPQSPDETFLWADGWRQVKSEVRYIFFNPGDYKVFVDARVGVDKSPKEDGYHTFTETTVIKATAPQFVMLLGAVIGGFISWILFPQAKEKKVAFTGVRSTLSQGIWIAYSVTGACLFSAIATILIARLSESQFLIKINVADFWGAIAVGFIAQYVGKAALDKLIPGRLQSSKSPTMPSAQSPAEQAAPDKPDRKPDDKPDDKPDRKPGDKPGA